MKLLQNQPVEQTGPPPPRTPAFAMRGLALALGTAAAIWLAPPLAAEEAYARCIDAGSTNTAWSQCGGEWIAREEKRLNATWVRVFPKLAPEARKALRETQRSWITFKEKSCQHFLTGEYGREGQVLHYPSCRGAVIAARRRDLEVLEKFLDQ
jgi:uncharacterized protein YecT (DUF1311 family)